MKDDDLDWEDDERPSQKEVSSDDDHLLQIIEPIHLLLTTLCMRVHNILQDFPLFDTFK